MSSLRVQSSLVKRSTIFIRMEEFYKTLADMIHCTPDEASALVKGLNTNRWKDAFFTPYIEKLPSVTVLYKGSAPYGIYPPQQTITVKDPRMRGEFSNVFTNTEGPFVYKVLATGGYIKHAVPYLSNTFKEIIIQTLLQSDPTHGQFICKLHGVFIAAKREIILKLENLPRSYKHYLLSDVLKKTYKRDSMVANSIKIKEDLIKLFRILQHFRDTYGFYHYDLHFDNLMVDETGEFKLIDFGYETYARIDGVEVGRSGVGEPDVYRLIRTLRPALSTVPFTAEFKALLASIEAESHDSKIPLEYYIDKLSAYNVTEGGRKKTRKRRSRSRRRLTRSTSPY